MKKRIIIISTTALFLIIVALAIYFVFSNNQREDMSTTVDQPTQTLEPTMVDYDSYNQNIISTSLQKDSIVPIDEPTYITIKEADSYLSAKDKVFVFESKDEVYIYPQKILVWHEIVNDTIDDEALSFTYCPLTGSAICYLGDVGSQVDNTYGTSGKLINSNLLMYDRDTDSYIPQILGTGINNELEGVVLSTKPIHWSDWEDVKNAYAKANVLSFDTGYQRDYFLDPYGSYEFEYEDSYYQNDYIMFPLMNENDGTYSLKKTVVGIKHGNYSLALDPQLVKEKGIVNFTIDDMSAVAFYDKDLKTVRVFDSSNYDFRYENNQIQDQDDNIWSSSGVSNKNELQPLTYFDVMWFAWHAYYPDSSVLK